MPTSTSAASRRPTSRSFRMSARDLITIGIYVALYTVLTVLPNFLGAINGPMVLVGAIVGILLGGIPFMLFLTWVHHPGMMVIFGVVTALLYLLTGSFLIVIAMIVVMAVLSEAILALGHYRSTAAGIAAYAVFSVWRTPLSIPQQCAAVATNSPTNSA